MKIPLLRLRNLLFVGGLAGWVLCPAAHASTAWGSLNNFDTVNDTGGECHGFEIEIEGIHSRDITYTYDWNHYGVPRITEDNSEPLRPRVFVRYESGKNPDGSWTAYTAIPSGPVAPTDGHQFIDPSVNFGGEHFGVGFYGTPAAVKYNWLKDDGTGKLIYAGAVNIATPAFTYLPPQPAAPAQVVAAIVPPPPAEPSVLEFGPACWVKDTKTKTHNHNKVELRDLVSDDPEDPNDRNWKNGEPDEVETEWRLLQTQFSADDGGPNGELVGRPEELPEGNEVITRRYDFYKYVGPVDAESGEAMADEVGPDGIHGVGQVTFNDHIDPSTGEWVEVTLDLSTVVLVGDYVGAQMAGFDPAGQIGLIDHLQDGKINEPYVERSIVIGGTPPVLTSTTGSLPTGLVFDVVSGVLSGTPMESATFTFEVKSTDATGTEVSATYHLTILDNAVVEPHVTVSTAANPVVGGTTSGDGEYVIGANVTVQASANPGFAFLNWTDGGTVVSTSAEFNFPAAVNRQLTANFIRTYTVTTSASPSEAGATTGGGTFLSGESVTVEALPSPGYEFVNWTEGGIVIGSEPRFTFAASADRELVAHFRARPPVAVQGDLDGDLDVDRDDLRLLVAALNQPASGPSDTRDLNRDGKINVLDARVLVRLFTRPGGAMR